MPNGELLFEISGVDNKIKHKRQSCPCTKGDRDGNFFESQSDDIAICQTEYDIANQRK